MESASAGDAHAFGDVVAFYEAPLRRRIRSRLGLQLRRRIDTDDVFQSTIAAAIADLRRFEYRGERAVLAWLTQIAERRIGRRARYHGAARRATERQVSLGEDAQTPAAVTPPPAAAERAEAVDELRRGLHLLAPQDRRVLELRTFHGRSFREIADDLGLASETTARSRFHRAFRRLTNLVRTDPSGASPERSGPPASPRS